MNMLKQTLPLQLIGLLVGLLLFVPPGNAQGPTETAPQFDPRFGLANSFVNTAEANSAGAGSTRIFLRWDVVQPGGFTDWKPSNVPDPLLAGDLAAGREVAAVLVGTPAWATESGLSSAVPPLEPWGEFVFKIATQYQGRITHWIIWDRPDIVDPASPGHTWDGTTEDYYRLLKEAYLKIKAVDPHMQVYLAGLSRPEYLAQLHDLIAADPQAAQENYFCDGIVYHLYHDPHQIPGTLASLRALLPARKPIWVEINGAPVSDDPASAGFTLTPTEQSHFIIQAFAMALAGGAERITFNQLRSDTDGLLRADDSRRPAFDAFRVVTTHLAGAQGAAWREIEQIHQVTFSRGDETIMVLWNKAETPATLTLTGESTHTLLIDEAGQKTILTAVNNTYTVELPGAACRNGASCLVGGPPRILIAQGALTEDVPTAPLPLPAAAVSSLPTASPTPTPPEIARVEIPPVLPTLTPSIPALAEQVAILPVLDSGERLEEELERDPHPSPPTPIPPVTILTVLQPQRILWLFVIGVIIFTVSYGLQVAIWHHLKRQPRRRGSKRKS
jgi:hypothetical protein